MKEAKIYKPSNSVTQSGVAKQYWVLEFIEDEKKRYKDPLMNWCGSKTTSQQLALSLKFPNLESAKQYAESKNINYYVELPKNHLIQPKSYADNFK